MMGNYSILKQQDHAHDDAIWTASWTNPSTIVTGSLDTTAKVWKLQTTDEDMKIVEDQVIDGFALGVISIDVKPQTSVTAIAAMDSKIRLFDLDQPLESCVLKTIDATPVDSWKVRFSPDGSRIATGSITGMINIYNTNADNETKIQLDAGKFAYSIDFSPDEKYLAAGNIMGTICVFDLQDNKKSFNINAHALPIRAVAFSPDSKLLLSGSDDGQIKIYSVKSGELVNTLCGHGSWILDLNFAPSGSHFASGSSDKKVKIWDMTNFKCIQTFNHHANQVTAVRYNPSGDRLATVSDDASIIIYDKVK